MRILLPLVFLAFASPARASGYLGNIKGNNVAASSGSFTGTVAASSFTGSGALLTGVTVTGNINVNNVVASSGSFTGTVAASSFTGSGANLTQIIRSSATTIAAFSTSQTTFLVSMATVTITTRGGPVLLGFMGMASNGTQTDACIFVFREDGALVSPFTATVGLTSILDETTGGSRYNGSFSYLLRAPAAGSHTYAIAMRASAGTCTLATTGQNGGPQWFAMEFAQ